MATDRIILVGPRQDSRLREAWSKVLCYFMVYTAQRSIRHHVKRTSPNLTITGVLPHPTGFEGYKTATGSDQPTGSLFPRARSRHTQPEVGGSYSCELGVYNDTTPQTPMSLGGHCGEMQIITKIYLYTAAKKKLQILCV